MKFDQFISYYKRKNFIKKIATWKLVPGPFTFAKNEAQTLLENEIFEASYLYSKAIEICRNQHADFFKFLFNRGFFES